ncbi:hypothetical protein Fmac_001761 [Flemingia macrophylla]|uniref:EF-hand domain-containing protein n=1 Tax=Flemingia macrophylla TaxID=520843 RepID=A0ABD1NIL3_9FABA
MEAIEFGNNNWRGKAKRGGSIMKQLRSNWTPRAMINEKGDNKGRWKRIVWISGTWIGTIRDISHVDAEVAKDLTKLVPGNSNWVPLIAISNLDKNPRKMLRLLNNGSMPVINMKPGGIHRPNDKGVDHDEVLVILMDAFSIFNIDSNASITVEELHVAMAILGDHSSVVNCRSMIAGVNSHEDGIIDFEEFTIMITATGEFLIDKDNKILQ